MGLIIKIAWRNILRHKGKSVVIGVILFVGALIMTVGNGVISGMDRGLAEHIIRGFAGHIILVSDKQESDNVFLEFMGKAVEPIYGFSTMRQALEQDPAVDRFLPVGKNVAMVMNEDGGSPGTAFLLGVDFQRYRQVFPDNMTCIEGRLPNGGEAGALVPGSARKEFYDFTNIWFMPEGDTLHSANLTPEARKDSATLSIKTSAVLMGFNNDNTTTDVRVPVRGVIKYKALNTILGHFVLMDIESYRRCLGYFSAADQSAVVSDETKALMSSQAENLDAMFSEGDLVVENKAQKPVAAASKAQGPAPVQAPAQVDVDAGVYNLVLVVLKDGQDIDKNVKRLNALFKEKGYGVRALSWKKAMGMIGGMAVIIKGALFVFVMFLFFVAIIIIVNTLSMAALERTPEIGMMRAVGARKSFVGRMFFAETGILSFFFGGIGIAAGAVGVRILAAANLTSSNDMVQLLFGGDRFRPVLSPEDLAVAVLQLGIVTLLAVIYPLKVARSITPLDAVYRD